MEFEKSSKNNSAQLPTNNNISPKNSTQKCTFWNKKRYVVAFLILYGMFVNFTIRICMSVAIVAMTNKKSVENVDGNITMQQDFNWNSKEKGLILSALFYGYFTTQIFSGYLTCKFGGSMVLIIGIGVASLLTLLTPMIAYLGIEALVAIRIIEGCFEGAILVAVFGIYNKWAPPAERSTMLSFPLIGTHLGTIGAMLFSGILAEHFEWPSIFYTFGTIGIVWCFMWIIIVRECPSKDKFMSDREKQYIFDSLKNHENMENATIPWKSILTSRPIICISVVGIIELWGTYTLITGLPMFLNSVLNFNVQDSGLMSAIPYICSSISLFIAGWLADYLHSRSSLSKLKIRQIFICSSFLSHAVIFLILGFITTPAISVMLVCIAVSIGTFSLSSIFVIPMDLAPKFSSVVFGIMNTLGTLSGIANPLLTGFIIQNGTIEEWRIVFYIAAGLYMLGSIIFLFFGNVDLQPWAIDNSTKPLSDEN